MKIKFEQMSLYTLLNFYRDCFYRNKIQDYDLETALTIYDYILEHYKLWQIISMWQNISNRDSFVTKNEVILKYSQEVSDNGGVTK